MDDSAERGLLDLTPWPRWAEGPIEQYLIHQPEQGDWPWEDHCNGLAGGILDALRGAGVVAVPVNDLRHLLDVYIDNGMVEDEDEAIVNRLWAATVSGSSEREA